MANQNNDELTTASFTLPAKVKARIEELAIKEDMSSSQMLRKILRQYFEAEDAKAKLLKAASKQLQPA